MPPVRTRLRRPSGPPVGGWAFGAGELPRGFWATVAVVLLALAVWLLVTGYYGYGAIIAVIGVAAGANLV